MGIHQYDRERVLVTGGAGFLGSHLCERLIEDGCNVLCLDNYFTGRRANIFHLTQNERFELIRHDLVNPIFLEVDRIYNLACPASPIHYQVNPVKTTKTSVMGAIHMLGLAKRVKARILQASTSEIYGDPHVHPQPESYWGNVNTIGPGPATTKESGARRPSSSTITGRTTWTSEWCGSSTPTARACIPPTGGS